MVLSGWGVTCYIYSVHWWRLHRAAKLLPHPGISHSPIILILSQTTRLCRVILVISRVSQLSISPVIGLPQWEIEPMAFCKEVIALSTRSFHPGVFASICSSDYKNSYSTDRKHGDAVKINRNVATFDVLPCLLADRRLVLRPFVSTSYLPNKTFSFPFGFMALGFWGVMQCLLLMPLSICYTTYIRSYNINRQNCTKHILVRCCSGVKWNKTFAQCQWTWNGYAKF